MAYVSLFMIFATRRLPHPSYAKTILPHPSYAKTDYMYIAPSRWLIGLRNTVYGMHTAYISVYVSIAACSVWLLCSSHTSPSRLSASVFGVRNHNYLDFVCLSFACITIPTSLVFLGVREILLHMHACCIQAMLSVCRN
jgi:hypothetical protein